MDFKKALPHIVAIVTFFATVFFVFSPQFQGKELPKGDIRSFLASANEAIEYEKDMDGEVLWTGTSFAGMPTYQITAPATGNYVVKAKKIATGFMKRPAGDFFAGMLCCYLFMIIIGVNPWLSIVAALGAGLATNGIVLMSAGHWSKVNTVFYLPLIPAGIILAYRKQYVWGGLVFALAMALAIANNHVQMLYYFGITLPIYGIARLVHDYQKGQLPHFFKATALLLGGFVIAFAAGAGLLLTTIEYKAETMRGGQVLETPIVESTPAAGNEASKPVSGGGLEWDYAMQWSNGGKDLLATYAPYAAGGGNGQPVSNKSAFGKAMRSAGFRSLPATFGAPTYHGVLPFTEGPAYLGAVVWALFLFGLFTARRNLAIWLGGGTLLIFLMSMGKQFEGFNRLLYDTLPLLNNFRAPSSALSISTMMMIILGVVGVNDWLERLNGDAVAQEKARKQLLYSGGLAAVLGLVVAFIVPVMIDFANPTDVGAIQRFTQGQAQNVNALVDALIETREELYSAGAWRSFLFVGLTFGALFLLYRRMIGTLVGAVILAGLVAVDFTGINGEKVGEDRWRRKVKTPALFPQTQADQQILQDKDIHYRVFNAAANTFNDAATSYHHKSIGGYSAVKLRRYNDLILGYLGKGDQKVISMLNGKYFITRGQDGQPVAQRNPNAFGPAWLVNNIDIVNSNDAEFAALGTTEDLKNTAIVHEDFADAVTGFTPSGNGSIQVTEYHPNYLTYNFNSDSEQLVVFSEIWYGPDLGWELTVDGEPVEIIRANYLLRAARIPAGQHTLRMEFNPSSYSLGYLMATICSLLILLGIIGYGAYTVWRARTQVQSQA